MALKPSLFQDPRWLPALLSIDRPFLQAALTIQAGETGPHPDPVNITALIQ